MTQGTVEDAVPRWINEHGIDLIVMGTHARKGLDRFLLGSTAEAIFRTATCPVLTVGPNVNPRIFDGLKISKVLYATALTRQAEAAATYALSFAQERSARLTVLHVLPEETETGVDCKRLASFCTPEAGKIGSTRNWPGIPA